MVSPLQILMGLEVTKVLELHGYVQLQFGNETGLSIYNQISTRPKTLKVSSLVGRTVVAVAEPESAIEIRFLGGDEILVDMRPQAFRGPEALQLNRKGIPPVIWN